MKTVHNAQDQYEEKKIKQLMLRLAELEGQSLYEENEALKADSFYVPSVKTKQTFKKRINRYLWSHDLKRAVRYMFTGYKKLVISFSIVLLLVATFNSEAVRVKFLDVVFQLDQVNFRMIQGPQLTELHIGWDSLYRLEDIPEGFTRMEVDINQKEVKLYNDQTKDSYILIKQYDDHSGLNLDTQDADEVKKVRINGEKGLAMKKKDVLTVVWQMDDLSFVILSKSTELTLEQLIEMAESNSLIK